MRIIPDNPNSDIWASLVNSSYFSSNSTPQCATTCEQPLYDGYLIAAVADNILTDLFSRYTGQFSIDLGQDPSPNGTLWECQSCLTDSKNNSGIGHFFGVPDEHIPFNTRHLVLFPASLDNGTTFSADSDLVFNFLPWSQLRLLGPNFGLSDVSNEFIDTLDAQNASFTSEFERHVRLFVANLVARMPVLAIAGADNQLPQVSRDGNKQRPYVITTLEVKWEFVALSVAAIIVGQVFVITVVLHYCRRVHIQDDSYLSVAHLLGTLVAKVDGGSLRSGKEFAACLDSLKPGFIYGRSNQMNGYKLVVDVPGDLERSFLLSPSYEDIRQSRME